MSWLTRRGSTLGAVLVWVLLLALAALPLTARRSLEDWLADLEQEDIGRRRLALRALATVDDEHVQAVARVLAQDLFDQDPVYREAVREAFGMLGDRVLPFLMRVVADPSHPDQDRVVELLRMVGAPAIEPVLEQLVRSEHPELRRRGAVVLERMGPAASASAEQLELLTWDSRPEVRSAALRALEKVDRNGDPAYRAAQRLYDDPEHEVSMAAWVILVSSSQTYDRARDPAQAAELLEFFERELGVLPADLRAAFDQGLGR